MSCQNLKSMKGGYDHHKRNRVSKTKEAGQIFVFTCVLSVGLSVAFAMAILRGIQVHSMSIGEIKTSSSVSSNTSMPANPSKNNPICFKALNGSCHRCQCADQPPASHFRGIVTDLSEELSESRLTCCYTCKVCTVYRGQCVVVEQHRFIYLHVMKSGGSSVHLFLKSGLCRLTNTSILRPTGKDYVCDPLQFKLMGCMTAIARYPGFFRWSIVRHPVPRAVSGWAMASRHSPTHARPGAKMVDFNSWAINTSVIRTRVWAMHWLPQVDFLLDARGCPMFDFVATMGRGLAGDMEYVLHRINSSELWAAYRKGGGLPREYASADWIREAAYQNLSAAAVAALTERYRADLAAFGFRMEGWREDGFF